MKDKIIESIGDFLTWCGNIAKKCIFDPIVDIIEDIVNKE